MPDTPPTFMRPTFTVTDPAPQGAEYLLTLPALVEFNARHNADHLFCAQYAHNIRDPPTEITHGALFVAVRRFEAWLAARGLAQSPRVEDGKVVKARPVGILMASDVTWFIAFVALLRLGVPVLCMSARLSPEAVVHLVHKTNTQALLVSPQLDTLIDDSKTLFASSDSTPSWHPVPSYLSFLTPQPSENLPTAPPPAPYFGHDDRNVVILHSSGTTGLPKPIFHSHAYLLGYAACHELTPSQVVGAMNVSTLPLFHGFGLLAPSLSLSVGLPFALPARSTIPTGTSTYTLLTSSRATSLLTVPSILEELHALPHALGTSALKTLHFVAVGGAPMKASVAGAVAEAGVKLLNHWGVTEIGALAPIAHPQLDWDWRFLRLRTDLALSLVPHEGSLRLEGFPPLTHDKFVVQDLLVENPERRGEVRIAGRADDLVVLATGEKVRPARVETTLAEHPLLRAALVVGSGRAELSLLLEPHAFPSSTEEEEKLVEEVWESVESANAAEDAHARISREHIRVLRAPLVRTPKGSIPRAENAARFSALIESIYSAESQTSAALPLGEPELTQAVRELVHQTMRRPIGDEDDFFERGMDSLRAAALRRRIAAGCEAPLPADIIYAHPSVASLCAALRILLTGGESTRVEVRAVREEYVAKVRDLRVQPAERNSGEGRVVLLTGSTGSLGSAMLFELVQRGDVERVYALNRRGTRSLRDRQEEGLQKLGVEPSAEQWEKVTLLEAELSEPHFGLSEEEYAQLGNVTHIIHNAWPMDFNRSLTSFRPHLDALLHILTLAFTTSAHLVFSSSIATVGRLPLLSPSSSSTPIKEEWTDSPDAADSFGYAEAKWICEAMLHASSARCTAIRIGQLVSPAWSAAEHVPLILQSSQLLGYLPEIPGSASWLPVDRAAKAMLELLFVRAEGVRVRHLENPVRTPWSAILATFSSSLNIHQSLPFEEWLERVKGGKETSARKILPFLEGEFVRMASGGVVLDMVGARAESAVLRDCKEVGEESVKRFVEFWRREGVVV